MYFVMSFERFSFFWSNFFRKEGERDDANYELVWLTDASLLIKATNHIETQSRFTKHE